MPRRLLAVTVAAVLVLAGCAQPRTRWAAPTAGTNPAATPSSTAAVGTIAWRPCPEVTNGKLPRKPATIAGYECGTLKVPQDWAAPADGRTFELALVRVRATGQQNRIGSLLVNPGGPGASGVDLAVYLSAGLPVEVLRRFDLIGFDPRGVGASSPVDCLGDADLDALFGSDPDPRDQAAFDAAAAQSRRLAGQCGTKYGDGLRLYSTEQAARDMDAIRAGVGDEKLTYLGYSYGTLLGAVYAQLFPQRVRALVLDGAVDPRQTAVQSAESQARGFELAFDHFAQWCRDTAPRCPIGPDARATVRGLLDTARSAPVRGSGGRQATAGWILTSIVASLYDQGSWEPLAQALDRLRRGDPSRMFAIADNYADRDAGGRYSNLFDANLVVNCTDADDSPTLEQVRANQAAWRDRYPLFGTSSALDTICAQWPGKRDPYPAGAATGAPPILVVGTTGDPATPYEHAAALAKMLGVGTLLTWQGEGHTAYPQTRCVTAAVNTYLIEAKPPADGTVCPPK